MDALLRRLLRDPLPADEASLDGFFRAHVASVARGTSPIDAAIAGGMSTTHVGFAFAAGYHAALRALVPSTPIDHACALCATESGGAHPRAIATTLASNDGALRLNGTKSFVTLATIARSLFVLASIGADAEGRNRLKLVRVPADATGLTRTMLPETPFAPEVPHASVRFDDVAIPDADVLPGDGWDAYVKPFRTIEDVHVYTALCAMLVRVGRAWSWPHAIVESLVATILAARCVAEADPRAAETHIALAGVLANARRTIDEAAPCWQSVDADVRARWERDRAILEVAGKARAQRREVAWESIARARAT
jgi:hypothetical protein